MNFKLDQPTRRAAIKAFTLFAASASLYANRINAHAAGTNPAKEVEAQKPRQLEAPVWLTLPPTPTLPKSLRSGLATINGASIFYAQFGQGQPILLLHGGMANSNYWAHQVEYVSQRFSVTVMDTRGHGRSPYASSPLSYRIFAQDVVGLLNFLNIPQAAVIGWSDGAITGIQLALTNPERVPKLFAFGANSSRDGYKVNGSRNSTFGAFVNRCKAEYMTLSPRPEQWPQLVSALRQMWRTEPNFTKQKLAAVKAITIISDGEYDEIIKRDHTERLAVAIPHARLLLMPGVSHFAMLQNPLQFNAALIDFLETI